MGYNKKFEKNNRKDHFLKPWQIALFVAIVTAGATKAHKNETKSTTPTTPTPVQVSPTPTTTPDTHTHRAGVQSVPENTNFTFNPLAPDQKYTIFVEMQKLMPALAE